MKIIVLDDESSIRDSLSEYLRDFGYQVRSAESAEEAITQMEQDVPDVVIVDIRLPGMDGDHLIRNSMRRWPNVRYLVHTGSVNYHVQKEFAAIGIDEESVLRKPVLNMMSFVDSIHHLMGAR